MAFYGDGKHNENMEYIGSEKQKSGIELILNERLQHFSKHNRSVERDVQENKNCQLAEAAEALIEGDITWMPDSWDEAICERMIGKSYQERLVIAGALIAAEIDRLNYTE